MLARRSDQIRDGQISQGLAKIVPSISSGKDGITANDKAWNEDTLRKQVSRD